MSTTVAIAGATGLLGSAFADGYQNQVVPLDRSSLNIDDPASIHRRLQEIGADMLINCAAHTDLEAAERDPELDRRANLVLPQILADACENAGTTLVQISSTGCYGQWKDEPYVEADPLRPTTVHHTHKAQAEDAIRNSGCKSLILRTGWLFGGSKDQPKNFVWKRIQEGKNSPSMTSDGAQFGVPTWVKDVVGQTKILFDGEICGTFNVVAQGAASRFTYVDAIIEEAGIACKVISGPAFKRLAAVSSNEMAINQHLRAHDIDQMPEWRHSLSIYVNDLMGLTRNQHSLVEFFTPGTQ